MLAELLTVFAICGCFLLFVTAIYTISQWRQKTFNERFPPISDDEFLARCPPGTNREIALKVRRIIAEQLAIEYERIYPGASFVNDLNAG